MRERFELVVSPQLISEVAGVLARPKFDRYVTPEEVANFLEMLRSDAVVQPDPAVIARATRDPHDDYLVALAKAAEAAIGDRFMPPQRPVSKPHTRGTDARPPDSTGAPRIAQADRLKPFRCGCRCPAT